MLSVALILPTAGAEFGLSASQKGVLTSAVFAGALLGSVAWGLAGDRIGRRRMLATALAETQRVPFDLTEAESELVAGYQTEYSSMSFALFWLGEYANILLMCILNALLFWGGWLPPIDWAPLYYVPGIVWLLLKTFFFFFMFSWVMATVPRYRYDQLMRLGWKVFLPISLGFVVVISGYLMATGHFG